MVTVQENNESVSAFRLRLGVSCIVLWWIPFWLLAPWIASALGYSSDSHAVAVITTVIIIIQTVVGILGVWIAGNQVSGIVRGTPRKQVPKKVFNILWHGTL